MRLKNRSVIITGGAQGLGEGIARRLASEGASVAIADRNGALAQEVADDLKHLFSMLGIAGIFARE